MNNTDKILEEFDEKWEEGYFFHTVGNASPKERIADYISTSIQQAEQEMIKRVVGEIDIAWKKVWDYPITNVKEMFDKRERSFNEGRNFGADKFKANLLSSLNKPTE